MVDPQTANLGKWSMNGPGPEQYPWKGTAYYGNTPFNTTLISHITGNLWMGGCIDGLRLPDDFKHVVSLYPWEKYRLGPDTEREEFELYDSEDVGADAEALSALGHLVALKIESGKTLIHCQAGLNRSGLITTLALSKLSEGAYTIPDAIALLREKRTPAVLCNPHFYQYLMSL